MKKVFEIGRKIEAGRREQQIVTGPMPLTERLMQGVLGLLIVLMMMLVIGAIAGAFKSADPQPVQQSKEMQ